MAVMTVEQEMEANELSDLLDGFLETLDKRSRIMFVRRILIVFQILRKGFK